MIDWLFTSTASALCYSIIELRYPNPENSEKFPHNQVVQFVLSQYQKMPDYLKFPFLILTLIFDIAGIFNAKKLFHSQPASVRLQQVEAWKNSSLTVFRDLIKFYESLVVLCWEFHQ